MTATKPHSVNLGNVIAHCRGQTFRKTDFRQMDKPLSIIFGTPEHGWLSVDIISDNYKFNIDASDVPVNPLNLLCDILLDLKTENKGEVWFHLEPASVFLEFKKLDKNYQLTILTADRHEAPRTVEKVFSGNFQEIIEPFISALALFYSKTYDEQHWPTVDTKKINRLQLITADT